MANERSTVKFDVVKDELGWVNPKVARIWDDYGKDIPIKFVEENRKTFGELTKISLLNPVRNLRWDWLYFEDSSIFSPAANAFKLSEKEVAGTTVLARYCPYMKGTKKYRDFWVEERKRCVEGYEPEIDGKPCGIRITGEHYFYLNYCRINLAEVNEATGEVTEIENFPRFSSMDYYWFKELDARENPNKYGLPNTYKKSIILAKSRRMGFSYKNAAGATYKYTFYKDIKVAIVSQTGEKSLETFEKCLVNIDWLTQYTEFGGPHIYRTFDKNAMKGSIKAGVKDKKGVEKGRKCIIYTVSLHNRDDKASGAGCVRVIFEEAGMIGRLSKAWGFTEPTLKSGKLYKGIAIVFGTGGQMVDKNGKAGSSKDFRDMFYSPTAYKFASFENIYEVGPDSGECGLFFGISWFREGAEFITPEGDRFEAIDSNGNVNAWVAEIDINMERKTQADKDKEAYEIELTQYCKTPREAFLMITGNTFPVAEIEARLERLLTTDDLRYLSTVGTLAESDGEIIFRPDIEGRLKPLDRFPHPSSNKSWEGAFIVYEQPKKINGVIMPGSYIVSVDTLGIDSSGGTSLIAIYVIKTGKYPLEIGYDEVVACYVGKPMVDPIHYQNHMLYKIGKFYNAAITHENDRTGAEVRTYFLEKNAYEMLLKPPADLVSEHIPNSNTNLRKSGHSMSSDRMKELGELYLKRWLLKSRGVDEEGRTITNLDKIRDVALLQELQNYTRGGNYDRVMALMGAIIQMRQLESYDARSTEKASDVQAFFEERIAKTTAKKEKPYHKVSLGGITDSRRTNLN